MALVWGKMVPSMHAALNYFRRALDVDTSL